MKVRFEDVDIGKEFVVHSDRFIKTDNTPYPPGVHLKDRYPNCINLRNKHRCVMGSKVLVDTYDEEEDV